MECRLSETITSNNNTCYNSNSSNSNTVLSTWNPGHNCKNHLYTITDTKSSPSVHFDRVSHHGVLNQTDMSRISSIILPQLGEQVTTVTTALSNPFLAPVRNNQSQCRCGKAPPIDEFTREDSRVTFDDWLPTLERAATWIGWTQEERLMQLAGHLRARAL